MASTFSGLAIDKDQRNMPRRISFAAGKSTPSRAVAGQDGKIDHESVGRILANQLRQRGKRHIVVLDLETAAPAGFNQRRGFAGFPVNDANTRHHMTE